MKTHDLLSNPFPGLRPFEFRENNLFFGREGQSEKLLEKLRLKRFLAVVGTSGSGKSSLVRAGLLPLLYGGFMTKAGPRWRLAMFRPSVDPIHNMAVALNSPSEFESSYEDTGDISEDPTTPASGTALDSDALRIAATETVLRRSACGLVDYAKRARMDKDENLLVVVDQFEELFRFKEKADGLHSSDEAAAFVKLLLNALNDRSMPIYVTLTMRSDFLGDCAQFRDLPETINESQYLIPRMTRDQQRDAITRPAAVRGAKMTPRLVNRLLNDIGDDPDQLPTLQHALMRTWDYWANSHENGGKGAIDVPHYESIGGMSAALSKHADEAYAELPDERSCEIAKRLFKALTETVQDSREIRRPAELEEVCAIAGASVEQVVPVIDTFRSPGRSFLMPPAGVPLSANSLIDISHESLIRGWALLKTWVEEEAQSAQMYRRLAEDALLHKERKVDLWHDPGLALALEWRDTQKPTREWAKRYHPAFGEALGFLKASSKRRSEEAAAEEQRQKEEIERTKRELESKQLLAEAQSQKAEAERARAEEAKLRAEAEQRRAQTELEKAEDAQRAALRESELNLELAEEQRQFAAIEHRAARRLRYAVAALVVMVMLAVAAAGYAFKKQIEAKSEKARAEGATREAVTQKQEAEAQRVIAEKQKVKADELARVATLRSDQLNASSEQLKDSLGAKEVAQRQALAAAARANQQAGIARKAQAQAEESQEKAAAGEAEANRLYLEAKRNYQKEQKNREALILFQTGELTKAAEEFGKLDSLYANDGDTDGQSWVSYNLGAIFREQDRYSEAEVAYGHALTNQEAKHGVNQRASLSILDRLAHLYQEEGRYAEAEAAYQRLFGILHNSSTSADNAVYVMNTRSDLAGVYRAEAKYNDTKAKQQTDEIRRLVSDRKPSGPTAPPGEEMGVYKLCAKPDSTLTERCSLYARFLKDRDEKHRMAEKLYDEVLSDREKMVPLHHAALAVDYNNLAQVYQEQPAKKTRAERLNALVATIKDLGITSPKLYDELSGEKREALADAYAGAGRYAPAEIIYKSLLETKRNLTSDKKGYRDFLLKLARVYIERKDYANADTYHRELQMFLQSNTNLIWTFETFGETVWIQIGRLYELDKQYAESERFYQLDLEFKKREATSRPNKRNQYFLASSLEALGNLKAEQKNLTGAIESIGEAVQLLESTRGEQDALLIPYLTTLGDMYRERTDFTDAGRIYDRARQLWIKVMADKTSKTSDSRDSQGYRVAIEGGFFVTLRPTGYVMVLKGLASIYFAQHKADEAEKLYTEALGKLESIQKDTPVTSRYFYPSPYERRDFYATYAATLREYAEFLRKTDRKEKAAELDERAKRLEELATSDTNLYLDDFVRWG